MTDGRALNTDQYLSKGFVAWHRVPVLRRLQIQRINSEVTYVLIVVGRSDEMNAKSRIAYPVLGGFLACVIAVVLIAAPVAGRIVSLSPPWQTTGIQTTLVRTTGTGGFSNGFGSAVPSASSGTWNTYAYANTQNLETDQYAVQGEYYVNVPATDLVSGSVDPQSGTWPNAGDIVLGISCAPHVVAAGSIVVWINESYNLYDSNSKLWLYSSPSLAANMYGYTLSGPCPQSYSSSLVTPTWTTFQVGQLTAGANPNVHWSSDCGNGGIYNCTLVLYLQMAFSLNTVNDVFATACLIFTNLAYPAACTSPGQAGQFNLGQVVNQ